MSLVCLFAAGRHLAITHTFSHLCSLWYVQVRTGMRTNQVLRRQQGTGEGRQAKWCRVLFLRPCGLYHRPFIVPVTGDTKKIVDAAAKQNNSDGTSVVSALFLCVTCISMLTCGCVYVARAQAVHS